MPPYDYGWKQFYTAVSCLAGAKNMKERLRDSIACLTLIEPDRDLPDSMREDFRGFLASMTSKPAAGDEGTIQATVETLGELDLHNAADKVISFYGDVCRQQGARSK